jgi:hypothetical protein
MDLWHQACQDKFVQRVRALLQQWKAGEMEAGESMHEILYEYEDKVGEVGAMAQRAPRTRLR